MADWVVISSVASAGGTLALAGTTYFSIRSANRAARVAEMSLLVGLRPLLVSSSPEDATQHVGFFDDVGVDAPGGGAQIAFRDADDRREDVLAAVESGRFTVDLLYGDYEGGQRVITRFGVPRAGDGWNVLTARHWQLDRPEIARPRGSFVEGRYEGGA